MTGSCCENCCSAPILAMLAPWCPCASHPPLCPHLYHTANHHPRITTQALSERLERLFEPWVASVVPLLLVAFGDSSAAVREATAGAAATIMRQLTGHGT